MAGKIALNNPKRIIPANEYIKIESQAKGSSITPVSSRIKKAANELIKKYIIKDPKAPKIEMIQDCPITTFVTKLRFAPKQRKIAKSRLLS